MTQTVLSWLLWLGSIALHVVFVVRAVIRPNREPAARLAWVLVILLVPVGGLVGYLLLGEMNLGRRRREGLAALIARLPRPAPWNGADPSSEPLGDACDAPFRLARSINRLAPTTGNALTLHFDHRATWQELIADIDASRDHVHVCFYIWLEDRTGGALAHALIRAAQRGVAVRVIADGVGSRAFIASPLWSAMAGAGVMLRVALKVTNPLPRVLFRRIDLRNHRKSVIVDTDVCWNGSANVADPEFTPKPRFAPWIDVMLRCVGPAARQAQYLFALDWMAERGDDIAHLLAAPVAGPRQPSSDGALVQVIGTGPATDHAAMSACFVALAYAAQHEFIATTPYFVPDDALLSAIVSCARRGVATTLILPAHNDSLLVGAASRASYADLLDAGVALHHFSGGLLHAKTLTVDGALALVGSANMDRRSLDLNYENNLLIRDAALVADLRRQQLAWLARSHAVDRGTVARWGVLRRLWYNLLAMLSPIL